MLGTSPFTDIKVPKLFDHRQWRAIQLRRKALDDLVGRPQLLDGHAGVEAHICTEPTHLFTQWCATWLDSKVFVCGTSGALMSAAICSQVADKDHMKSSTWLARCHKLLNTGAMLIAHNVRRSKSEPLSHARVANSAQAWLRGRPMGRPAKRSTGATTTAKLPWSRFPKRTSICGAHGCASQRN